MAGCSTNTSPYPLEMVLQEHSKYVVFIKELQSQVRTLQDFRSRVLQAFPHLDIGLYCSMAMAKFLPKRHLKSGFSELADFSGQFQTKYTKKSVGLHIQPRKFTDRSLGYGCRTKSKKSRVVERGKKCVEKGRLKGVVVDKDEREETSTGTSNSFLSESTPLNAKLKCDKMKSDCSCCVVHRQDSGFSTDGKDKLISNSHGDFEALKKSKVDDKEDELMNILDIIEQRSVTMRSIVEQSQDEAGGADPTAQSNEELMLEIDRLQFEKEVLVDRVLNIEIDNKLCREEINRLKDFLIDAEVSKRILEDRLDAAVSEREQLGTRINRLHTKFVTKSTAGNITDPNTAPRDSSKHLPNFNPNLNFVDGSISLPERLNQPTPKLKVLMDKTKVSAILQESRTLELQRQLLVSVIRNEVARCRMEQQEKEWNHTVSRLQHIQTHLQKDVEALKRVNGDLQAKIQKISTELRMERTKRRVLERALHAAYREITTTNNSSESSAAGANDYSKEIVHNDKQKRNLLKQRVVNSFSGKKMSPSEEDIRIRNKPDELPRFSSNNEIFNSTRNGLSQTNLSSGKCYIHREAVLKVEECGENLNNGNFPAPHHSFGDQVVSQLWSYRLESVPDKKVTT